MEGKNEETAKAKHELQFDLGTFEGFNFRSQSGIWGNQTAAQVVNWDHNQQGEAEFWPSGDNEGVQLVFKSSSAVTGSELLALDKLLDEMGGDSEENYLKVYFAVSVQGHDISTLDSPEPCGAKAPKCNELSDLFDSPILVAIQLSQPQDDP